MRQGANSEEVRKLIEEKQEKARQKKKRSKEKREEKEAEAKRAKEEEEEDETESPSPKGGALATHPEVRLPRGCCRPAAPTPPPNVS